MKKNKGVYYVDIQYGDKTYSITDKNIVKKIKTAEFLLYLFASLVGLTLIGTIIFASSLNHGVMSVVVFAIGMIMLGVFIWLGFHFGDKRDILIHNSPEYKAQEEAYFIKEAEKQKKRRLAKAKELVEAYEILDNTPLSQEEKINLLEKYMKN